MPNPSVAASVFALCGLLVGCQSEVPRGKVNGSLTVAGKPVSNATILFENAAAGVATMASVENGTFTVASYQGLGLPPGTYRVAVVPGTITKAGDEMPLATKKAPARPPVTGPAIPTKYLAVATSGLSAEVQSGDNPPYQFDLTP